MQIQMTVRALRSNKKLSQSLQIASELLAVIAAVLTVYVCAGVPWDADSNITGRALLTYAASFFMLSRLVALIPKQ